jgi:hypothetical protein
VRERVRLIEGHTIFGIHEYVPRPCTYVTLLRDPVSLTISQFNFVSRKPRHWLHDAVTSSEMTLAEYVGSGISLETDNSQTRALAGDTVTPFGGCSDRMLQVAKSNIERHFSMVGLTERFDETLILLRHVFGWSRLSYVRANVAPQRIRKDQTSPETLRRIAEQNAFDVELHRWASERFEQAIGRVDSFADDLRRLRRVNALYRPWGHLTHTVPRRLFTWSRSTAARGPVRP